MAANATTAAATAKDANSKLEEYIEKWVPIHFPAISRLHADQIFVEEFTTLIVIQTTTMNIATLYYPNSF
jgi:hypothetical protein